MDNVQVIENLKQLLVEHTSNTEIQITNNLTMIFQSFQNKSLKEDIDSYAEFVLLGASLFELKAKRKVIKDNMSAFVFTLQVYGQINHKINFL